MNRFNRFLLIVFTLSFLGCSHSDHYIGAYSHVNLLEPIQKNLTFTEDSIYVFDHKNKLLESYGFYPDSIEWMQVDSFCYLRDYRKDIKNRLDVEAYMKAVKSPVSGHKLKQMFTQDKVWETTSIDLITNKDFSIRTYWIFKNSSELFQQRHYYYDDVLVHYENEALNYTIEMFNESCILYIFNEDTGQKFPAMQVVDYSHQSIVLLSAREYDPTLDTLVVDSVDSILSFDSNPIVFSTYEQNEQSYGGYANYEEGSQGILKIARELDVKDSVNSSGFVVFNFTINNDGRLGRFGLEQLDWDFNPTLFSPDFVKKMFAIVLRSTWHIDYRKEDLEDNDEIHGFLMFKIKNGKIVDVVP